MIKYNLYMKPNGNPLRLTSCREQNFTRINKHIVIAALIEHFLNNQIYNPDLEEIKIISPTEIVYNEKSDLNLGAMNARFITTDKYIYSIFHKLNEKYSRQFLCYTILSLYDIVSEIFSRTRLRMVATQPGVYYLVFRSTHNYDTEISLNYAYEENGRISKEQLQKYIKKAAQKYQKEASNARQNPESLSRRNY